MEYEQISNNIRQQIARLKVIADRIEEGSNSEGIYFAEVLASLKFCFEDYVK